MVYLARKNGAVVHHADKDAMMELDGVKPEREITDGEFEAAEGLARIIGGAIFLGKTDAEKAADAKAARIAEIDGELDALDKEYLTLRVLSGIGSGEEYAARRQAEHAELAAPLREERKLLCKE